MKKGVKQILEGLTMMFILTGCGGEPAQKAERQSFSDFQEAEVVEQTEDLSPVVREGWVTDEFEDCTITSTFLFPEWDETLSDKLFTVEIEGRWEGKPISQRLELVMPDSNNMGYDSYALEREDINFDGYNDLRVQTGSAYGSGGSWGCFVGLVWNPQTEAFEVMESFPKLQTEFDREGHRVIKRYQSGALDEYVEEYTIVDGEYLLTQMLHLSADFGPDSTDTLHLYHYVNGKLEQEHVVKDSHEAAELYPELDYWWRG